MQRPLLLLVGDDDWPTQHATLTLADRGVLPLPLGKVPAEASPALSARDKKKKKNVNNKQHKMSTKKMLDLIPL